MSDTPQTPFQLLGGTDQVRRLVDCFYDLMDADPDARALRAMHAADLAPMRDKLTDWLTGWLGGPPLYAEKHGGVCITEAHAPYVIDATIRDQWLACMQKALVAAEVPEAARTMMREPLARIAEFLRNH